MYPFSSLLCSCLLPFLLSHFSKSFLCRLLCIPSLQSARNKPVTVLCPFSSLLCCVSSSFSCIVCSFFCCFFVCISLQSLGERKVIETILPLFLLCYFYPFLFSFVLVLSFLSLLTFFIFFYCYFFAYTSLQSL